jgi:hypothetical protein
MSSSDGMDSTPEYILSDACWFLLLCPIVPGAQHRRFLRLRAGNAYSLWEAPEHASPGVRVFATGQRERQEG